jgi:PKD repeat protein
VYVYNPQSNKIPEIVSFTVDDNTPFTGQPVTFTVVASDPDGDALKFTVSDAYEVYCVESFGPTAADEEVTLTVEKSYATVKPYTVYAYVYDGVDNTTSSSITITVTLNFAPVLASLPDLYGSTGVSVSFAADVYDLDDDPLLYTWEWGDGSTSVTDVEAATHAYAESGDYVYRVYVNDGCGHNVSDAAGAFINAIPVLDPLVDFSVTVGETHTFTATVTDADWEDVLTYTWDFGDGSDYAVGSSVDHAYASTGTYTYTVWVDDGFVLPSHNVTDSGSVQVLLPLSDPPVANAGPDQTESGGLTVQFDGSGSSDDVGIVSYTWTFTYDGGPVTLTGVSPTFVFWVVGVYDVTLTVVDGDGQSDTDTVQITIPDIIPEFPMLLLPVAGIVILLVGLTRRRKR